MDPHLLNIVLAVVSAVGFIFMVVGLGVFYQQVIKPWRNSKNDSNNTDIKHKHDIENPVQASQQMANV